MRIISKIISNSKRTGCENKTHEADVTFGVYSV